MSITTDITDLLEAKADVQVMIKARNILKASRDLVVQNNASIQALVDDGDFDVIPTSIKTALNSAWSDLKTCEAALEDVNIIEVLLDRP